MITLLTTSEFMKLGKQNSEMTLKQFLTNCWTTIDEDTNGWKYKGKFTTDIKEAESWYKQ